MAATATPLAKLSHRYPGGWTAVPHSFFKQLPKRLTYVELVILGNILDDTVGRPGAPEWATSTLAYFARLANCTEDGVAKAIKNLRKLELIEVERVGRQNRYRACEAKFEAAPTRAPRSRKPAMRAASADGSETLPSPDAETDEAVPGEKSGEGRAKVPATCPQCSHQFEVVVGGRRPGEQKLDASRSGTESVQALAKPIPVPEYGYPPERGAKPEDKPAAARRLTEFCTRILTPRLGTVAPAKQFGAALDLLHKAKVPAAEFEAYLLKRLRLFETERASWAILPLLAEDLAKTARARRELAPVDPAIEVHRRSAHQVRSLLADPATAAPVRGALYQIWPELAPASKRENPEQMLAKLRAGFERSSRKL